MSASGIGSQHSNISKGKWGGSLVCKSPIKVDRNKNVTLNTCPSGSYE